MASLPSASFLAQVGINPTDFRREAQRQGLFPAGPVATLGRRTTSTSSTKASACDLYRTAVANGQQAAIVASLRTKCDAEKALASAYVPGRSDPAIASSGAANDTAPAAPGMSPVVIGAIAVAVGLVGFVVYSRTKRKER